MSEPTTISLSQIQQIVQKIINSVYFHTEMSFMCDDQKTLFKINYILSTPLQSYSFSDDFFRLTFMNEYDLYIVHLTQ